MDPLPGKPALKDELLHILSADLDTRALEQSYLARGDALRIEELRSGLAQVVAMTLHPFGDAEPAALGALVLAEEDRAEIVLWLAPYGGGNRLADGRVQVVTPRSPLGRALLGMRAGDDCEVALPRARPDGSWSCGWIEQGRRALTRDEHTDLVLQLHVQPTGKTEPVRPSIGLHFSDRPPARPQLVLRIGDPAIDVAPTKGRAGVRGALVPRH